MDKSTRFASENKNLEYKGDTKSEHQFWKSKLEISEASPLLTECRHCNIFIQILFLILILNLYYQLQIAHKYFVNYVI